ncbi:MFS transporter [Clostridium cellulovorans]|uniref:Major facilitator superfamily MFS_1 n=1 Tax=Clostridium cellulovorans (strain ATCC 35296 / DSM 3052 / OCM 3 / 743B) TaxID=573061 RepID=D9SPJ0_CLOC7|nr:MFS transporter [Clostridium cellulovorans]ADL50039.1 major facilitator superfamily MFS_1 [Clostridium cellulovorans 743B]
MVLTILLIIIYLAFISLGLPDSLLGSAWPSMYPNMGVPISYAGIVSMVIAGGTIVSSLFSDKVIRKLGTGVVTSISVFMTAAALLGFSVSTEFYQLCLFAIPLGLGAGSVDAALNNFVALNYKAKHMSWLHCFWGVGAMTGPIIMSYCLERGAIFQLGYRTVAIIQFSLVIILIATLSFWKKAVPTTNLQGDKKNPNEKEVEHKIISKRELLKLPGAKHALLAFFCYCAIESTTGLWGSSFAVMSHGLQAETAAKWASLFYFGITFGRFLSGFITLRLNNRQMVRLGEALIAVGIIMIMLPLGQVASLIGFIITGIGCAPIYPSLLHETPANFGAEYSQSIMGVQMACAYVGTTFMPPLFGILASYTGYSLLPFYTGGILLLMFIMIETLNKRVDAKNKIKS